MPKKSTPHAKEKRQPKKAARAGSAADRDALDCDHSRSPCPVACVLDFLGDKWTLLIIRDLVLGKTRYQEFLRSPEGIPTNLLADRLKRLEAHGIVDREFYQQHPPRAEYLMTEKGAELGQVLRTMAEWGHKHIPGTIDPEEARAKLVGS